MSTIRMTQTTQPAAPARVPRGGRDVSGCGGRLQIDMNSSANVMSASPIEHVVWPEGSVQPGSYDVGVKLYARREPGGPIPFQVRVTVGEEEQFFDGSVARDGDVAGVTTVEIPRP